MLALTADEAGAATTFIAGAGERAAGAMARAVGERGGRWEEERCAE